MATMHALVVADTSDMPRDEWLELRRRGIGGSDAAAIAGLNPYRSPWAVWLEKTGQIKPEEPSEAAYWGTRLEGVIAEEFAKRTGLTVERVPAMLRHPEHEWMIADIDGLVVTPSGAQAGVLEVKTAGGRHEDEWADGRVPEAYMIQGMHYLAVTGLPRVWFAALIGGQRFLVRVVERDEELIAALIRIEADFWRRVQALDPPDPSGSERDAELLARLHPEARDEAQVVLPDDARDLLDELLAAQAALRMAEERVRWAENRLKLLMGDAATAVWRGQPVVVWKNVTSMRIDTKRLEAEHPELVAQYRVPSVTRRFLLTKSAKELIA